MKIVSLTVTGVLVFLLALILIARPSHAIGVAKERPNNAAQLFSQNCAKCHGKDGRAKGLKAKVAGVRNLADTEWQDRVTDERIFNSINNGKGKMPAFGKKLSEADVNSLVNYVRSLKK